MLRYLRVTIISKGKLERIGGIMVVTKLRGIRQRGNSFLWDVTVEGKRITGTCSSAVEAEGARSEALKGLKSTSKVEPWSLQKAVDSTHPG